MRRKIIQLAITLIGTALLCLGAVYGERQMPAPEQKEDSGPKDAGKDQKDDEIIPEDDALAMIQQEEYRSTEGLSVPAGTRISVLMRAGGSEFAKAFEKGCRQAGEELNEALSYKGKDKITISCNAPTKAHDISGQGAILDEELNLYPDVMAVSLVDAGSCEVQFDLALENGVTIIGFDSPPGYKKIRTIVGTDNAKASAEAADHLIAGMASAGKQESLSAEATSPSILVFSYESTSVNTKTREKAFSKEIEKGKPRYKIDEIYHLSDLEIRQREVAEALSAASEDGTAVEPASVRQEDVIAYLFDKYPNVGGVFITDEETAKVVLPVMMEKEIRAKVVAFGNYDDLFYHTLDQCLVGAVQENAYGMGYATTVASLRLVAGLDNPAKVNTGYIWMPKE